MLSLVGECVALAAEPLVEAQLATQGDIWQGQRIVLNLTIKTPGTFASAPAFDLPQVPHVILIPPQGRPVLGTEMIGDDTFTTQLHELTAFPQKSGTITIPPFKIRFDSSAGFGKPVQSRTVTTPPISFDIERPPGTEALALVLTTTNFVVTESWKPEPRTTPVAVGTAYSRTIQCTADDLPGIVLPAFPVPSLNGLRAYRHEPQLDDKEQRGTLIGQRTETVTFVCERPGQYELSAMTVSWWNPETRRLQEVTLPAHTIAVSAPPTGNESDPPVAASTRISRSRSTMLMALGLLAIIVGCGWSLWPSLRRRWQSHQRAMADSESHAFRAIVQACRAHDPHAAYRAILAWRDKLVIVCPSEIEGFTHAWKREPSLAAEFDRLESILYGAETLSTALPWPYEPLLTALSRFRQHWLHRSHSSNYADRLPDMNSAAHIQSLKVE
jgi:hypothetical protein